MTRPRLPPATLARFGVMLIAPLLVFGWEWIAKGLADGGDDLLATLPQLLHSARLVLRGELLWTPNVWLGMPLLAEPEFAALYPPHFLLLLGSPLIAFTIYVFGHYLAAELTFYAYLRTLQVSPAGSLFGALAYAFTGFMLGHRGHTMYLVAGAWAPLVLLAIERASREPRQRWFVLGALSFAMLPFSGAVQLTVYLGGTALALGLLRGFYERSLKAPMATLGCIVPGMLIACAQLVPAIEYSQLLYTEPRAKYSFATDLSFPPWLLATLYVPSPPVYGEMYSRVGALALSAAAVSMLQGRKASSVERAYRWVLFGALLLMVGRYLPPLAWLTYKLPLIGVMRGPARHNFELGLAASVLAAYGYDRARQELLAAPKRWWAFGLAFGGLSFIVGWAMASPDHALMLKGTPFLIAIALFAAFVAARTLEDRTLRSLAFGALTIGPSLEAAYSCRLDPTPRRQHHGTIEAARRALPETVEGVRVLAPWLMRAGVDSLAGNTALYHPGASVVNGYLSIAFRDGVELLQVDMHGQQQFFSVGSWTTLPSVLGVTHVVLPSIACGSDALALAEPNERCASEYRGAPRAAVSVADCRGSLSSTELRYALETRALARGEAAAGFTLGLASPGALQMLTVTRTELGNELRSHRHAIELLKLNSVSNFAITSESDVPIELIEPRIVLERAERLAVFGETGLVLEPKGTEASASAAAPKLAPGRALSLRFEARAAAQTSRPLVVGLFDGAGAALDHARIEISPSELGDEFRRFEHTLTLAEVPTELELRAAQSGSGVVELRRLGLYEVSSETAVDYPYSPALHAENVEPLAEHKLLLGPRGRIAAALHLPFRAVQLRADVELDTPLDNDLVLGLEPDPSARSSHTHHQLALAGKSGRFVRVRTTLLTPDARDVRMFLAGTETSRFKVHSLTLSNACSERRYVEPRPLGNGLFLYRNADATPRAYTVSDVAHASSVTEARELLLALPRERIGRFATVDAPPPPGLKPGFVEGFHAEPRRVHVVVHAPDAPTLLVLSDHFDPSWQATIDGQPVKLLRANGLVRGVFVPRGRHTVEFEFRAPTGVWIGLVLSVLGLLAALLLSPWLGRRASVVTRQGS